MKLLYLSSEYPGLSHTFILREIEALREQGHTVLTASIRRPASVEVMPELEKQEHKTTFYIKERALKKGVGAFVRLLRRAPRIAVCMFWKSIIWCVLQGPKSMRKAAGYLLEAALLLEHMNENDVPHVHVHFANPASTVAMIAAVSKEISFSISAHGPDIFYDCRENLLALKAEKALFVRCISHYCVSQFMRLLPQEMWGKLHIVRCGVDPDEFVPVPTERDDSVVRFLCLGRICPAKAQPLLVEAFAKLQTELEDVKLTIVGGGEELEALQAQAAQAGLQSSIVFTGAVGRIEARNAYDSADVFVLPSVAEGVPVVLMEAMAKEIPCIATNITGISELITHNESGLLATPGDVESLYAAMKAVTVDKKLRHTLGKKGRYVVAERYSIVTNAKGMAQLFLRHLEDREHHHDN